MEKIDSAIKCTRIKTEQEGEHVHNAVLQQQEETGAVPAVVVRTSHHSNSASDIASGERSNYAIRNNNRNNNGKTIRVFIRLHGSTCPGKVLMFDNSIDFNSLCLKVRHKLLGRNQESSSNSEIYELFLVCHHGQFLIEEVSEVENNDEILLRVTNDIAKEPEQENVSLKQEPVTNHDRVNDPSQVHDNSKSAHGQFLMEEVSEVENNDEILLRVTNDIAKEPEQENVSLKQEPITNHDRVNYPSQVHDNSKSAHERMTVSFTEKDIIREDEEDSENDDGSDGWDNGSYEMSSSSEDDSDDSDYYEQPTKKMKSFSAAQSPLQVIMNEKDIPFAPGKAMLEEIEAQEDEDIEEVSMLVSGTGRKKADQDVKDRIIKLLNTGFHDQSNENEAKNAMKLAQRLMRKHNLSQVLLLKERDAQKKGFLSKDEVLTGGMVHIKIFNRNTGKPAQYARWIDYLTEPIAKNFSVRSYSSTSRGRKCTVTFYGIYTNAQLAAYAFKVATERIAQMAAEYQPIKYSLSKPSTKSSRLSYCLGIVKGIKREVRKSIRAEKEKQLRKLERARMAVSMGEAYEESDNESDYDNGLSGEALDRYLKQLEEENQAALVLIDHKTKVAEQVLKDNGIELSSARNREPINFDYRSYHQGIEDSNEVDINQRAIRDEVKVKKEK